MWQEIFDLAINNGLWAVLFLGLLIFQLKDSKVREGKYQATIETLGKSLEILQDVKDDVVEIKDTLENFKMFKKKTTKSEEQTNELDK